MEKELSGRVPDDTGLSSTTEPQSSQGLGPSGFDPSRGEPWLVWSNEHRLFWAPNRRGYTGRIDRAGRYTKAEAEAICAGANYRANSTVNEGTPPEICMPAPEAIERLRLALEPFAAMARALQSALILSGGKATDQTKAASAGWEGGLAVLTYGHFLDALAVFGPDARGWGGMYEPRGLRDSDGSPKGLDGEAATARAAESGIARKAKP